MKKFIAVAFATIGSLILIFAIVFTSMELVINDETYINNEFAKLGVNTAMGMSNEDLVRSTMRLISYMQGDAENIDVEVTVKGEKMPMFALDQEVEHMKDVRQIYLQIKGYRDMGVLAMLVLFLFAALINFQKAPQMLAQGYLSGSFIALLFFGFLGTWAAMDFTNFWTFFHQMLFWNDLWLFDTAESRMINMLPEQMFSDLVGRIFLFAGVGIALLIVISIICMVVSSEAHKRRQIEARKRKKARLAAAEARKQAKAKAKAEAEKAKRIAAKKKKKAAVQAQRAKEAQARAKAQAKARAKAARRGGKTGAPVEPDDVSGGEPEIDLSEGVSEELSEGYASDFFQSATYADFEAGRIPTATTAAGAAATTTTTSGGAYPETTLSAEFFKSYGAARTVSEQPVTGNDPLQPGVPGEPLFDDGYREVYDDGLPEQPRANTGRNAHVRGDAGRSGAKNRAPAKKSGGKPAKKPKKRSNVQDDTGFFDD